MGDIEDIVTCERSGVPIVSEPVLPAVDVSCDMNDVLSSAMTWVDGNLDIFLPKMITEPDGVVRRHLGSLLDLAITCRFLCHRKTPVSPAAEKILDGVAEVFQEKSFHDRLLRMAVNFRYYLWILAILWENDRLADPQWRRGAQILIDYGYGDLGNPNRTAYELMELRYILDLGGLDGPVPPLHELCRDDPLEVPISSVDLTEAEAYAATHAIFFLSDFVARPLSGSTPGSDAAVDLLLETFIRSRHWDLVSELIVCRRALGRPESRLDRLGRSSLAKAQLADGAMPGPHFDLAEKDGLAPEKKNAYTFQRCYHTTLATVMCAASSAPSR
jgi:uncharacterized protein DUF6895